MNKPLRFTLLLLIGAISIHPQALAQSEGTLPGSTYKNADYRLKTADITYDWKLDMLIFEMQVEGQAGRTVPKPIGKMEGAPVLGYVFPTTLKPTDVGFSPTDGIVAMALTSHPDMDDTPLWDENNDSNYGNDGLVWHPHWVILTKDPRVPGGLSVKEYKKEDKAVRLPKTAPGMPMYFDSPGFNVVTQGKVIRMGVPAYRMNNQKHFKFDAVSCYMEMSHHTGSKPLLGVYQVYHILSGKLTLPYAVKQEVANR